MDVGATVAGVAATFGAVVLAAYLAARQVVRACMRREHDELRQNVERLALTVAVHGEHDRDEFVDVGRRLERIEHHLGYWSPPGHDAT